MPEIPPTPTTVDAERYERIRRVKRWLRFVPRRATLHRYPGLGWLADAARKRDYLWSFRAREAVTAIYIGWLIGMTPIYGMHMVIAAVLCVVLRGNLMIGQALLWITNPITAAPVYAFNFWLGKHILATFGVVVNLDSFNVLVHEGEFHFAEVAQGVREIARAFYAMTIGGLVVGLLGATVTAVIYRNAASRYARNHPQRPSGSSTPS